jgi:hypothetical protein
LRIVDEDSNTAPLVAAWAEQGHCAVAMPLEPLSPENSWSLEASLTDGDRSGTFRAELEPSEGSGPPPLDLGSGTWLAGGELHNIRIPINSAEVDPSLPQLELPEFLIGLSSAGKNGERRLSIATVTDGAQDLCSLTTELENASLSDIGQLSASFNAGSILPTALGSVVQRGAIRAQLADDSVSLSELVILAVLDVETMATESGGTVEETCAHWQEQLGSDPCVPCGDPIDTIDGPSHCITTVLEWSDVTQAQVPLQPISIDSISPDCPTP